MIDAPAPAPGAALVPAQLPGEARLELRAPVFVSDLHLCEARGRTVERFLQLLERLPGQAAELLVLGDLFEFWAGDDSLDGAQERAGDDLVAAEVAAALRRVSAAGTRVLLMHGNRDLLLGERFLARCGARLLADPCTANLDGETWLLSHGDAYCTRDQPYQAFRRQARDARFQAAFLARSLEERRALLGQARRMSESGKQRMAEEIMDVTPEAIDAALRSAGARRMIHGHTHRPARHEFELDGAGAERWVLTDWDFDEAPLRGGGLRWTGRRLEAFSA
jgi:UDP-2,3-diacylglucosamine hydrolase